MRQYRGKRSDNDEWVYGWRFVCKHGKQEYIISDNYSAQELSYTPALLDNKIAWHEVIPESVGQSTGLKDKKRTKEYPDGVEIYEGDICRWVDTEGRVYIKEVNWDEGMLCWKFGVMVYHRLVESGYYQTEMEVIGNIHQNPELLGSEEKP